MIYFNVMNKIKIYVKDIKYPVGFVRDNVYYTMRNPRLVYKTEAGKSFGISKEAIEQLKEMNVENIVIKYIDKSCVYFYKTTIDNLLKNGFEVVACKDIQYHLLLEKFII